MTKQVARAKPLKKGKKDRNEKNVAKKQDSVGQQHARMLELQALSDITMAEGYEVTSVEGLSQTVQGKKVYEALDAFRLAKKKGTFNKDDLFPHRTSKGGKLFICGTSKDMKEFLHYYFAREHAAEFKLGLIRANHAQTGSTAPGTDNPIILEVYNHGLAATQKTLLLTEAGTMLLPFGLKVTKAEFVPDLTKCAVRISSVPLLKPTESQVKKMAELVKAQTGQKGSIALPFMSVLRKIQFVNYCLWCKVNGHLRKDCGAELIARNEVITAGNEAGGNSDDEGDMQ
jgi:hypothetical protein